MTDPVKALSDEAVTEAIREKGGAFSFGKWAIATIAERTRERDEAREAHKAAYAREKQHLSAVDHANAGRAEWFEKHRAAEADNARLLSPSDYALEIGAYMLAKSAATWFGDRIPETFDLTMSKTILKPAYFAVCEAALSPTPVGER